MRIDPLAALVLLAAGLATQPAHALSRNGHLALPLGTEEAGNRRSFGTVRRVLAELRRRDRSCTLETYEYGGTISCGARPGEPGSARVLIGFASVPTRFPDFAEINSVRLNGVNGGELPPAERQRAVATLLGRAARR